MTDQYRTEFRVLAMDKVRRVWTIRHTPDNIQDACIKAAALRQQGLRVRVIPYKRKLLKVKPAVASETRTFREQKSGEMSDLADAKKRYKSPG